DGGRHHVPGERGEERVHEALPGAALGRVRAVLPRAAALPPGPPAAGAGARALALGRLGPGRLLGGLGVVRVVGRRGPAPWCAPPSPPPPVEQAAQEEAERRARGAPEEQGAEAGDAEAEDAEDAALPALPVKDVEDKPEQQTRTRETDKSPTSTEPRQQPSALFARGNRKAVKSPQRSSSKIKENKHPFALYGWGEKQTDTGSQKTHNVCASAPVHEIHESALRAKNRRQVEKRRLVAQRQRAHSVDVEKNRKVKASSSENPWMTEYMRTHTVDSVLCHT
uniref:Centriole, cilia and spindle associated protein n=1 Tax=Macaca fascicularis TaxID=9541 RepID=A0A7N9D222_MACFA